MENWLSSKEFRQKYKISSATLWRRVHHNKIKTKQLYGITYYLDENFVENNIEKRLNIIYCRVSNTKQSDDLKRQETILREYCVSNGIIPDQIIKDIASGMSENRNGLKQLIQLVKENKVDKIYISYKDRLTRFGFDYFKYFFSLFNTEIIIVNLTQEEDFQQELTQDFISILHHFSMKLYSNRRKELKQLKKNLENDSILKNNQINNI